MDEKYSILLIEPETANPVSVKNLLARIDGFDYELDVTDSYGEGLKKIPEKKYSICLVEYMMDGESGIEFMQQAMAHLLWTPVIFIASENYPDGGMTAMRAGATDYLIKEFLQPVLLERAIRFAVERKRNELQLLEIQDELTQALAEIRDNQKELVEMANLKSVQQLAAAVAHEFAQPLQALTNYLAIIKGGVRVPKYIAKAEIMLQRIAGLTENLRNITGLSQKQYVDTKILDIYSAPAVKKDQMNILIVDDEPAILETMQEMFRMKGVDSTTVTSAREALQIMDETDFKLILSDINMPEMSGPDFFNELKRRGNETCFVFMTGYEISDAVRTIVEQANGLINKPFNFDVVYKKVLELTA